MTSIFHHTLVGMLVFIYDLTYIHKITYMEKHMNQIDFFKALSDPTRLNILKIITLHQSVCVCEFTAQLQLSQPKISRHLALLRECSILATERQGQWVYYHLHPQLPAWAKEILNLASAADDDSQQHIPLNHSVICQKP